MRIRKVLCFAVFILCLYGANIQCEEVEFVPARFSGDFSILEKVEPPAEFAGGELRLHCFSSLDGEGRFVRVYCNTDTDGMDEYVFRLANLARRLDAEPAQVNGRKVWVWLPFTIVVKKDKSDNSIQVFPHIFLNSDKYGLQYSAPQLYWWRGSKYRCRSSYMAWVGMEVDRSGVASDPRIVKGEGAWGKCFEGAKMAFAEAKYIPAFFQEDQVSAQLVLPYFSRDKW